MGMGDRRDFLRRDCSVEVQVCWEDGSNKVATAECVNLSRTGARIRAAVPVETFRKIRLTSEQPGFGRSGVVRYCTRQSNKFVIGVEFTDSPPPAVKPNPSHN
jgi:hypothetical protein